MIRMSRFSSPPSVPSPRFFGVLLAGLTAAFAVPSRAADQDSILQRPTVLERVEERFEKNPDLKEQRESRPEALDKLAWMEGRWDMTLTYFQTSKTPQRVEKGARETKWELDRRWMVSRETVPGKLAVEYLGYDPWRKNWVRQYVTSWGRGGMQIMFGQEGWRENTLPFTGTVYFWGEPAEISLRLVKMSDDAFMEIYEEKLPGGVLRPIIELSFKRQKPAAAPAAPAAKKR